MMELIYNRILINFQFNNIINSKFVIFSLRVNYIFAISFCAFQIELSIARLKFK